MYVIRKKSFKLMYIEDLDKKFEQWKIGHSNENIFTVMRVSCSKRVI